MDNSTIKISVLMPVLNRADTFRQAIESVIKFSEYHIEIIVIDGGSTDGTLGVINEYTDKISYCESGLDSGICNAFNRGLDHATGELVTILNSDDYWTEEGLHELLKTVLRNPEADIYHSSIRYIDKKNKHTYVIKPNIKRLKRRMSVFHPTMFVKRSCYQKVGVYNENYKYAMDSDWCLRALKSNAKFCEVPAVLTNMRLEGTSDTNFMDSLREYRDSVIRNDVAGVITAYFYYGFYAFFKWLMKYGMFSRIKSLRNRRYHSGQQC